MADEKNLNVKPQNTKPQEEKPQETKKSEDKKPSAFSGVDSLFKDAAPKTDAAKAPAPGEKQGDELAKVPTQALHAFPDHPYTVDANDDDMAELVDSIQREGLLEHIVVQRRKEGGFEILSGHRRAKACEILGISEVPVIIKYGLSKDQATLLMVDANLKRKNILPMDEAKALRMQLDAMDRMGQRPTHGKVKRTDEAIAEKIGKNRMYVQRKVKLLDLTPNLQEAINNKTLSETPAFEIAFLPAEVQELVLDWMEMEDRAPTVAQAISVRQHQQELDKISKGQDDGKYLDEDQIALIMSGERLEKIFPPAPEPEKTAEKEAEAISAPSQAPTTSEEKEGGATAILGVATVTGTLDGKNEPGGAPPLAGVSADGKAIPFQPAVATPTPGSTATPSPTTTAPNAPAQAPAQPAQPSAQTPAMDAQRNYIRTEYMAELRKENVILPKTQVKEFTQGCSSNSEYVAAIVAALEKGREKTQEKTSEKVPEIKAVESKLTPEKPVQSAQDNKLLSPPVTAGASASSAPETGDVVKLGEAPKPGEAAKVSEATKTADVPKPPLSGVKSSESPKPLEAPKPQEPPKVDKTVTPPAAPKTPEVAKPIVAPTTQKPPIVPPASATPTPKAVEAQKAEVPQAGKVNAPLSPIAPASKPAEPPKPGPVLPPKTEPIKQDSGTEGLDNYLKNKPRPGQSKPQSGKTPSKPR